MQASEWYHINDKNRLDTPALVVYPDRVQSNINALIAMINDVTRLRPHVKTHKSDEVTQMMLRAGINKFKCATIAEAEMLGRNQAPDVLLAYQPTLQKLERLIKLIIKYPQTGYSCLVDNAATAEMVNQEAEKAGLTINIYIDLNVGMDRTGIPPQEAQPLINIIADFKNLKLTGLHAYDGHIHDADYGTRREKALAALKPVLELQNALQNTGYTNLQLVCSSSPTLPILMEQHNIQCCPGTFVYWDRGYQLAFAEQQFEPAVLVVARVISLPAKNKVCIDLGHKSVAAENELAKRVYFLNAPELKLISQSEEHLVAETEENHSYKIGDVLYGLPYHICPTVALYEKVITIKGSYLAGEWITEARNRKITV
ncbi:D-TA family PLP-dependent enzyme [Mucilaginibacter litoreus]|uniref:D-TA family PLP-dependent enzyme n=1 Tax=Mucilaginibacter litoreus TaxID=1048221 RepID=A0ABW3ASR7_9SPHI